MQNTLFGRKFALVVLGVIGSLLLWSAFASAATVVPVHLRYLAFSGSEPTRREQIRATLSWWAQQSLGNVVFDGPSEVMAPLRLLHSAESYECPKTGGFLSVCGTTPAFQAALSELLAPSLPEGPPGLAVVSVAASLRARLIWLNINGQQWPVALTSQVEGDAAVLAHEIGHGIGVGHANMMFCGPVVFGSSVERDSGASRGLGTWTPGVLRAEMWGARELVPGCDVFEYYGLGVMGRNRLEDGVTPDLQVAMGWRSPKSVAVFPTRVRFDTSPVARIEHGGLALLCWWQHGVANCSIPDDQPTLKVSWLARPYSLGVPKTDGVPAVPAVVGDSWCDHVWGVCARVEALSPPTVLFSRSTAP